MIAPMFSALWLLAAPERPPIPYPVDPQVHLVDPEADVLDHTTYEPHVSNAFSYVRYAVTTLRGGMGKLGETEPRALATSIRRAAAGSGIPMAQVAQWTQNTVTEDDVLRYLSTAASHHPGKSLVPLSRTARRVVEIQRQLEACVSPAGDALQVPEVRPVAKGKAARRSKECCLALARPALLAAPWANGDGVEIEAEREVREPEFDLVGTKAWLAVCAPLLRDAPATVADLKLEVGEYGGPQGRNGWFSELHPVSLAKQAGRRVYRKAGRTAEGKEGSDLVVSETLDDACTVRETEVIARRPDGALDFWSYDADGRLVPHGFFPVRKGVDSIKFTPDSCMGCHYTFDAREYTVMAPSFVGLSLRLRTTLGVPQWSDHSHCALPGEPLVRHTAPHSH